MRKLNYFLIGAFFLVANVSRAQFNIGAKGGFYFSNAEVTGVADGLLPSTEVLVGRTAGLVASLPVSERVSFAPELLYTEKGFAIREGIDFEVFGLDIPFGATLKNHISYVELPALMKYEFGSKKSSIYVMAGPSLAYGFSARTQVTANFLLDFDLGDYDYAMDDFNRWDWSGVIGAGVRQNLKENVDFFADFRYQKSVSDVIEGTLLDLDIRNKGYAFSGGVQMRF